MSKSAIFIAINLSIFLSFRLYAIEMGGGDVGRIQEERQKIENVEKGKIVDSMNCEFSEVYFSEIFDSFFPISDSYYFSTKYSGRWVSYFKRPAIGFLGGGYILFGKIDKVEERAILPSEELIVKKIKETKYRGLQISQWKLKTDSTYTVIRSEKEFIVMFDPMENLWKVSLDALFHLKESECVKRKIKRLQDSEM